MVIFERKKETNYALLNNHVLQSQKIGESTFRQQIRQPGVQNFFLNRSATVAYQETMEKLFGNLEIPATNLETLWKMEERLGGLRATTPEGRKEANPRRAVYVSRCILLLVGPS